MNSLSLPIIAPPDGWDHPRPYIYVNMAMSLDGKITTAKRESFLLGTEHDWERMDHLRSQADGILNGARTIRDDDPPVRVRSPRRIDQRVEAGKPSQPVNVIVTNGSGFPKDARILCTEGAQALVLHPSEAGKNLADLLTAKNIEGQEAGAESLDWEQGMAALRERGIGVLLAEGGGSLNGQLAQRGLIDEFFVTVTPKIVGGRDAPTPVEGDGLTVETLLHFALASCESIGNEVFLRYKRGS